VSFQIGDKVIYPNHGLGVVEKVEEKTILGMTTGFFHLRIIANETTVLVPVSNVDNVGLRRAITDEEVERLFYLLSDGKIDNHQNWKGRFKDNSDKMRTGSIYDMADVLKSLTFLAKSKSLSFREKRMLDRAKALIVSEISEVMRLTATSIEERVNQALEQCFVNKAKIAQRAAARATTKPPAPAPAPKAVAAPKPVPAPKPVVAPKPVAASKPMPAPKAVAAKPVAAKAVAKAVAKPVPAKAVSVKSAKPAARAASKAPRARAS
jgi:CarD family transcriptional regulator, regulator of rRNA transcription